MKRTISIVFILGFILSGIIIFSGFTLPAPMAQEWSVASSTVKFKIKNAGFTVDGTFKDLSARITFDEADLPTSSIDATVTTKSISTGNGTRDGHLRGEKYFDAAKFPVITLHCNTFSKQANGNYMGNFKLTIKDVTKNVTIPFTYAVKNSTAAFNGTFTINRLDYGVGSSSMIMSDNVTIIIEVNTTKK